MSSDSDYLPEKLSESSEGSSLDLSENSSEDLSDHGFDVLMSEEYKNIIRDLRKPKLHLDPEPKLSKKTLEPLQKAPKKITDDKEFIKYIVEQKLSKNWTMKQYKKYMKRKEEQKRKEITNKKLGKKRRPLRRSLRLTKKIKKESDSE